MNRFNIVKTLTPLQLIHSKGEFVNNIFVIDLEALKKEYDIKNDSLSALLCKVYKDVSYDCLSYDSSQKTTIYLEFDNDKIFGGVYNISHKIKKNRVLIASTDIKDEATYILTLEQMKEFQRYMNSNQMEDICTSIYWKRDVPNYLNGI